MKTATTDATQKVLHYFEKQPAWSRELCLQLRQVMLAAHPTLTEEWKWGPHYSSNGMVCGIGAFQKHIKLTFFNGSAMKDDLHLFNHCVENEFSRSIKYTPEDQIDLAAFTTYVQEAVALNKKGFKRTIESKAVAVPPELTAALQQNNAAFHFFENLSYGYKKEFAEHVTEARQEKTKQARIAKIIGLCEAQQTLNHKYKK